MFGTEASLERVRSIELITVTLQVIDQNEAASVTNEAFDTTATEQALHSSKTLFGEHESKAAHNKQLQRQWTRHERQQGIVWFSTHLEIARVNWSWDYV